MNNIMCIYLCVSFKVAGNAEKAREILVEAIENVQLSKPLLEVFYFYSPSDISVSAVGFHFSNVLL